MKRLIAWLAAGQLFDAQTEGYLRGLEHGRAERPMTCGLSAREHCFHSYMYDPGQ